MEIGFFYDFHGILLEMAIRLPCWLQIQLFWKHMEYVWIRRVIHGGILYAFIFIWVTEVYWCLFSLFFVRVSKICLTCTWHNFNLSFLVLEAFRTCGSTARFLLVVMHTMHGLHNRLIDSLLVGALEHEWIMTFHSVGNGKSSQLTFTHSIIFQRGRLKPPNQITLWWFNMAMV